MLDTLVAGSLLAWTMLQRGLTYLKEEREWDAGGEGGVTEEIIHERGAIGLGVVISQTGIERTR